MLASSARFLAMEKAISPLSRVPALVAISGLACLAAACAHGPDENADACGAEDYASLVGSNIAAVTLPADLDHRVIFPDTAVTQDDRPERLNIHVDKDGVVERLRCG